MDELSSFGGWLRRRRKALDLTQEQLAQRISCSTSTLRKIESEERRPSEQIVEQLAEVFDIPSNERTSFLKFARGRLETEPMAVIEDAPWRVLAVSAHLNLPVPLTSFIGREIEQEEVLKLIGKNRLVTLIGSGGVGKTRLSLKVSEQLLGDYAHGVWLVELAPILDPLLVPRTTAIAIGLREEPQRPVIDMLSDYLREKQMLIILDNCEHLLDACAQFADIVLKRCPRVKMLATSREALGILGEAIYRVPSLQLPDLQELLGRFREYESICLFEDRAQLVQMNFSLTVENISSVAKICNQLDGIPLAIELAAARVSMFSTEQIAARLQESFHLLTTGNRAASPRHQTLLAAIDWSYNLLSPAECILLQRLAVFVGGWTLESAEAVCAREGIDSLVATDLLSKLVGKSLILLEQSGRYKFLETIRQYAREKLLKSGEIQIVRQRHLKYFLSFTETKGRETLGSNQIVALKQLDEEYENIREAMDWAIETGHVQEAAKIGEALAWLYWWSRGLLREAYEKMTLILNHPETTKEKLFRATALIVAVFFGSLMELNSKQGQSMIDEAIAISKLARDQGKRWQAWAYSIWGYRMIWEDSLAAKRMLDEASSLARELNETYLLANTMEWQGNLAREQKDYPRARELSYECIKLFREIGNHYGIGRALANIGVVFYLEGDYVEAQENFKEALEIFRNIDDKNNLTMVLGFLGQTSALTAKYVQAEKLFEEKLRLAKDRGWNQEIGTSTQHLAYLYLYQGNPTAALALFREGLPLFENWDDTGISLSIAGIASAMFELSPENSEHAAQLLGSAQYVIDKVGINNLPYEKGQITKILKAIRTHLGEANYQKFESRGKTMTFEAAIALAQK